MIFPVADLLFSVWQDATSKVLSLREQLLRTPADRNSKPEFRLDTLLPVWLWAALDTRHLLLNIHYILFPVRQLYFIKHYLQASSVSRKLTEQCAKIKKNCVPTVIHRTNILSKTIWCHSATAVSFFPFTKNIYIFF